MHIENKDLNYESPQVLVIEVEVEKGFALSLTNENPNEGVTEDYM